LVFSPSYAYNRLRHEVFAGDRSWWCRWMGLLDRRWSSCADKPYTLPVLGQMAQAHLRRNHALSTLRIPGISHVLAVASGKGGVGKTTVAVNLALALHQDGVRVGLFDADLHGPNIPLMLGIHPKPSAGRPLNIPVVRTDRTPYIPPLERFGLKAMSLGFLVGDTDTILADGPLAAGMIRQTLQDVLWGELDVLLLDFPPGTGEPQQTLLKTIHLDAALLVTTPQDLSLMDTSRSLGLFRQAGVPILGVIENMSFLYCPHCGEPIEVFARSQREWAVTDTGCEQLGRIPLHMTLSRMVDTAHPLLQTIQDSPEAVAFRRLAAEVSRKVGLQSGG
jgi:ATP-binding protein involved in chromosome partitioning